MNNNLASSFNFLGKAENRMKNIANKSTSISTNLSLVEKTKSNMFFSVLLASYSKRVLFSLFAILVAFSSVSAHAGVPKEGSFIVNRATVEYVDQNTGTTVTVKTNQVRLQIAAKEGVDISAAPIATANAGQEVCFAHQITNTGNTDSQVQFSAQQTTGDTFNPQSVRLVIESSPTNGVPDTGEESFSLDNTLISPAQDFPFESVLDVLVCATVPAGQNPNTLGNIQLTATTVEQGESDVQVDQISVIDGPDLQVGLLASTAEAAPGDLITFTLNAQNVGNTPALPATYTVDGAPSELVLLNFPIPANSTFAELGDVPAGLLPLYHRIGAGPNEYTTTPPLAGEESLYDRVAFGVADGYPVGQAYTVPVRVTANDDAAGQIIGRASIDYQDPQNPQAISSENSNIAPVRLPTAPVDLGNFTTADFELQNNTLNSIQPLFLQIKAPQCNLNPDQVDPVAPEQLLLNVRSVIAGDIEVLTMVETGVNTGIFRADIPGADPASQLNMIEAAAVRNNGVLEVTAEDSIEAVFDGGSVCAAVGRISITLLPSVTMDLRKTVTPTRSEVGGIVTYTLTISNTTSQRLDNVLISDRGAFGFQHIVGSATFSNPILGLDHKDQPLIPVDEIDLEGPAGQISGGAGPNLQIYVGSLAPSDALGTQDTATIVYRSTVGPGAVRSDGINTAVASGLLNGNDTTTLAAASLVAKATVIVEAGLFTDRGYIIGKVYADCDFDRQQGREELGIPGVRIYLNDGTYVVTDVEGKYSFYGLEPRTWVAKLDNTTLPPGFQPKPLDNRHAGVGDSRFVDLIAGELHRADFADGACFPEMIENVKARRGKGEVFVAEIEKNLDADLLNERGFTQDVKARPSSGLIDANRGIHVEEFNLKQLLNEKNSTLPSESLFSEPEVDLGTLLKGEVTKDFGFIGITDNAVLPRNKMSVMVKGRLQSQFKLFVNDQPVAEDRVGQKVANPATGVQAWEFVSVEFKPGANQLKAQQIDSFGNVRAESIVTVMVADSLADIVLRIPEKPIADGSPVWVEVALVDDNTTPVGSRTAVTLEVDKGRWLVDDLNPDAPGVQVFVEGGATRFELAAPTEPMELNIRATAGPAVGSAEINFLPDLRPMLAVGLIEGSISLSGDDSDTPTGNDRFSRELNNLANEQDGDDYTAGIRGSLFMKGRVLDHYLLTARFESDQDEDDTLFRDIQPDQFYPVYGDSGQRGFDAQSTGKVFARLERERNYVQYGDFTSSDGNSVLGLARYNRSMTGLKGHIENDSLAINLFVSNDSTKQLTKQVRGNGTSGPYRAADGGRLFNPDTFVENSEQVELIVLRRGQDDIILDVQQLSRFRDYQLDLDRGEILFRGPVQSLDAELNPIFIRFTYEVESGGEDYITAGGSFEWRPVESFALSGTYLQDDNPDGELTVQGVGMEIRPFSNTAIMIEHANTIRPVAGGDDLKGEANRAEIRVNEGRLALNIYAAQSDSDYSTASGPRTGAGANISTGTLGSGREEYGVDMSLGITDSTTLRVDAYKTEDRTSAGSDTREHGEIALSQRFGPYLTLEANVARTEGRTADGRLIDDRTVGGRITTQLPYIDNSSLYAEYRKDTRDSEQSSLVVGAEAPVSQRTRVYAKHEIKNTLDSGREGFTGDNERHQTVFGISTSYMDNQGSLFSEYRARDAFDGRSAEAAIGVRHGWQLSEGLNLDASFEQVRTVEAPTQNQDVDAMSAAVAMDYTANPLWKATGRLEWRQSKQRESWLNTVGIGRKLSRDWTFLARNSLTYDKGRNDDSSTLRDRLQVGLAWRDTDTDNWNVLARYELEYEDVDRASNVEGATNSGTKNINHIVSTHVNYKPTEGWLLSGRYAYKRTNQQTTGLDESYDTHLVSGRVTYDFAERWDIGVAASSLFNKDANKYGLGLELGYLVGANLWVSAGYNVFGYADDVQLGADYTNEGAYFRFRYKFDETLFSGNDPFVNNTAPQAANVFERSLQDAR